MTPTEGSSFAKPLGHLDAVGAGHFQIEEHDVGPELGARRQRLGAGAGEAHDLEVGRGAEHGGEPVADDRVIVGKEDADRCGHSALPAQPSGTAASMRRRRRARFRRAARRRAGARARRGRRGRSDRACVPRRQSRVPSSSTMSTTRAGSIASEITSLAPRHGAARWQAPPGRRGRGRPRCRAGQPAGRPAGLEAHRRRFLRGGLLGQRGRAPPERPPFERRRRGDRAPSGAPPRDWHASGEAPRRSRRGCAPVRRRLRASASAVSS